MEGMVPDIERSRGIVVGEWMMREDKEGDGGISQQRSLLRGHLNLIKHEIITLTTRPAACRNHPFPRRIPHLFQLLNCRSALSHMQHNPDELLDKLRDLSSPNYLQNDTAALHIRAMALVGRLKSLYRAANTATRLKKEETAAARQEMDQSHLNLQNLLYEKRHLEREIEKCRQFA